MEFSKIQKKAFLLDWYDSRPKLGADIEGTIMNTLCRPEKVLDY